MAITVSPIFNETDTGEILTDFSVSRSPNLHHGMADDPTDYYEDEFGLPHHRYAELDQERIQQIEADASGEELIDYEQFSSEDAEAMYELVGGEQSYQLMTAWAAENLEPETIERFDEIISSNNLAAIEEAIVWLEEQFLQGGGSFDNELPSSDIEQAVYESYPYYKEMTAWAEDALDVENIAEYNQVMASGNRQEIANYVHELSILFNESHNAY